MQIKKPYLFIELDDYKIVFSVIKYDEGLNYNIIHERTVESEGILNGKVIDIQSASNIIKKIINEIEEKIEFIFASTSIIFNPDKINCLNVSGYKKLNGSKVSKDDVTYILNDIKSEISSKEKNFSLVHLLNSSFSIDSDNLENLPLGLFGEFYNQNMTFFLVEKNVLKNIKLLINRCGLNIDRIVLRPFVEGINLLSKNIINKNFVSIRLGEKRSNLYLFKERSFIFSQEFNFGVDIIIKDISKLCSLKYEEVEVMLNKLNLEKISDNNENFLDKKYFINSPFREVKEKLVIEVIKSRFEELFEIFYEKNINLAYFRKTNQDIYICIENLKYLKNFKKIVEKIIPNNFKLVFSNEVDTEKNIACLGAAELLGKGWEKEAIPIIQTKKSIISRFLSDLFN